MPDILFSDAAPAASALRPTGPAAMETLPPSVREPTCAKVLTALASLRMKTKSVSSKPIWPPKPPPTVPIAVGADLRDIPRQPYPSSDTLLLLLRELAHHDPSANRATTTPLPNLPEPRKPALKTVKMARPLALARICGGMILSGPKACRGSTNEARMRPVFLHSPVKPYY